MNSNTWHVTESEKGERLDKLLVNLQKNMSRHQIQNLIKQKRVFVNGKIKKANYICRVDDYITWEMEQIDQNAKIEAENLPLSIIYEDDSVIVLNKPQGMLVHPTNTVKSGTLVNALMFYTKNLSTLSGDDRPGIVHRLDKDTSGVIVIAKNNDAHEHLKNQFQNRTVKRVYEAVVFHELTHDQGVIKAPIGRDPKNRLQMTVIDGGKDAETHYKVLQRFSNMTHVQCELVTGRTHQIRVHMKYIKHPIVGDPLYCRKKSHLISYQALFAKRLCFHHPKTNEWQCYMTDTPIEFSKLLKSLDSLS